MSYYGRGYITLPGKGTYFSFGRSSMILHIKQQIGVNFFRTFDTNGPNNDKIASIGFISKGKDGKHRYFISQRIKIESFENLQSLYYRTLEYRKQITIINNRCKKET